MRKGERWLVIKGFELFLNTGEKLGFVVPRGTEWVILVKKNFSEFLTKNKRAVLKDRIKGELFLGPVVLEWY